MSQAGMSQNGDDVFVILSGEGLFWDGQGWVPDWKTALQFDPTKLEEAWLACERLCKELRATLGCYCVPSYISSTEIRLAKWPRRRAVNVATRDHGVPGLAAM